MLRGTRGLAVAAALAGALLGAHGTAQAQQRVAVADGTPQIDAAIEQSNWSAALKQLDQHIAAKPNDVQAQFKRANVLARMGRDQQAITAYQTLIQQHPELPEPYNNLAALYAKQGDYGEARVALQTAIKANPAFELAYRNLGDLYLHLATAAYQRAVALNHQDTLAAQRITQVDAIVSPKSMRNTGMIDMRRAPQLKPALGARAAAPGAASSPLPASGASGASTGTPGASRPR
jgi:Flp pilus assembly protein TadD